MRFRRYEPAPVRPSPIRVAYAYADLNAVWAIVYAGIASSGKLGNAWVDVAFFLGSGAFLLTWWVRMHRKPGFRPEDELMSMGQR